MYSFGGTRFSSRTNFFSICCRGSVAGKRWDLFHESVSLYSCRAGSRAEFCSSNSGRGIRLFNAVLDCSAGILLVCKCFNDGTVAAVIHTSVIFTVC